MYESFESSDSFDASQYLDATSGRTILISAFHQYPEPLGGVLEIATRLTQSGNRVLVGLWADSTIVADTCNSFSSWISRLLNSRSPQEQVQKIIQKELPDIELIALGRRKPIRYIGKSHSRIHLTELQNNYDEPVGKGFSIGASLIDGTRKSNNNAFFSRKIVELFSKSYDDVLSNSLRVLTDLHIDDVLIFNGRRTHDHALSAAAKMAGCRRLFYEVGGSDGGYDVYSHGTHDRVALQQRMLENFDSGRESIRYAEQWFQSRRARIDADVKRFTGNQLSGTPISVPKESLNIIYYSTSTDELASVGGEWNSRFGQQEDAIKALSKVVLQLNGVVLTVRTHPHMMQKSRKSLKEWNQIVSNLPHVRHIPANSQIDSYDLLEVADAVVVFGSTMGIEAAYHGIPTATLSPAFYDEIGAVASISSINELETWISKLTDVDKTLAFPYGFFSRTRGFRFRTYISNQEIYGTYLGAQVGTRSKLIRTVFALENRLRRITW